MRNSGLKDPRLQIAMVYGPVSLPSAKIAQSGVLLPQLILIRPESATQRIVVLAVVLTAISVVYALAPSELPLVGAFAKHLFFLPLTLAALWFGWTGGLLAALVCVPILIGIAQNRLHEPNLNDIFAEGLDLVVVGAVLGYLGHRERQKQMQLLQNAAELQRVNHELASSVEQVKQSVRLAAVGQLAASLAHELRNPLASVEGATELLRQNNLPEETRQEFFGIVQKECSRMNRLLTDLLDFSRPRKPDFQPVDLTSVIKDIARLVGTQAAASGIVLKTEIEASLQPIQADPEQIKQVLMNLSLNALQSMNSSSAGEVTIRALSREGRVEIEVHDQGSGVSDDDLERLFHPFFTTKAQGSGLGLPVAQEIVHRHGGELSVRRNPNRGMTFSFWLPTTGRRPDAESGR